MSRRPPPRGGGGGGTRRAGAGVEPAGAAAAGDRRPGPRSELGGDQVEGRRAVLELLTVGRRTVRRIMLAEDQDPSPQLDRIEELAGRMRVPVETVPRTRLDAQARTESPQGVLALARPSSRWRSRTWPRPTATAPHRSFWWPPASRTPATSAPSCAAPNAPA